MSVPLENVRMDLRTRMENDQQMSAAWIIVPLLPIIGVILLAVGFAIAVFSAISRLTSPTPTPGALSGIFAAVILFGLLYILIPIIVAVYAIMFNKFIRRRNLHFNRQILLYEDLISLVKQLAGKKNMDITIPVNYLERSLRDARFEDSEKNPALYAILSASTPLVGFYSYYFLMKDFFKHERREDMFFAGIANLLVALGVPISLPMRTSPIPDRSFAVYFIASLFTVGIFTIYWIYALVSDPNAHFRHQSMVEDTIIAQVSPALA
jgi:hypothetical protein